jgi:hypothetical protein
MNSTTKRPEKVIGVLLTEDGWKDLAAALEPYALTGTIGKFLYCRAVQPDGPYFVMIATRKGPDGSSFEAEIAIPHQYVRLFISATDESQIGFTH